MTEKQKKPNRHLQLLLPMTVAGMIRAATISAVAEYAAVSFIKKKATPMGLPFFLNESFLLFMLEPLME